jgi:hypothetical protein
MNNGEQFFNTAAGGGYAIQRSIRLNEPDSAYLSRTPASQGNRRTWTWAGWIKRSGLNDYFNFYGNVDAASAQNGLLLRFIDSNAIDIYEISSSFVWRKTTTSVYRDSSAWLHLVVQYDTTNATAGDRVKIYVNGERVTIFSSSSDPSLNYDGYINTASAHSIGRPGAYNGAYFSGYLADIHFIDGQALTPTSFGEFSATTGVWVPKAYSGPAATGNSFWLPFSDNSAATATTLGKDNFNLGNNWSPSNLSVTAGAGNDSLIDVPTNGAQTDTGAGGEVRGNYCTLNPLSGKTGVTLSNGNLDRSGSVGNNKMGTFAMTSGKWYWEITLSDVSGGVFLGITEYDNEPDAYGLNYVYSSTGDKYIGTTLSSYGVSYAANDVIGFAYDADNGSLVCYKNNTSQGTLVSGLSGKRLFPLTRSDGQCGMSCNFGQRAFAYTAPSGFKALNTANLPTPTILNGATAMDVKLYTGNGSTQTISGLGFSPDLVWIKKRNSASNSNHLLADTVRGVGKFLSSSGTFDENTFDATWRANWGDLTAFNSDGFTVVAGSSADDNINDSPNTHVAWAWDAGSSTVTNTAGTISSQVRVNASAGFSVVTYTAVVAANQTVGHGLGVAPSMIICKSRSTTSGWPVYHRSLGTSSDYLVLNLTDAKGTSTNYWGSSHPTSTVFGVDANGFANNSGNMVAYCFAPVAGYSSFGSYTGNGSTDGPFVYTGFRPRWVMVKRTDSTGNWTIKDTSRPGYNVTNLNLFPNLANAETTEYTVDLLSNGFKVRETAFPNDWNASGGTYIYAAFAESPFQYARAR